MSDTDKTPWTPGNQWHVQMGALGFEVVDGINPRPIAQLPRPHEYYTDYYINIGADGEEWKVLSDERAEKEGNYVATPEIKADIDAKQERLGRLIAAAPEMAELLEQWLSAFGSTGDRGALSAPTKALLSRIRGEDSA